MDTRVKEKVAGATEEDTEAGLVLNEFFSLGVDNVEAYSDDDHTSDCALSAPTVDVQTRARSENGQDDNVQDHAQQPTSSPAAIATDLGQMPCSNSRRVHSPTTQALENQFRMMTNGIISSVDVASGCLRESADEVLQRLKRDLVDIEQEVAGELQTLQTDLSREACIWLKQQSEVGIDDVHIQELELRLAKVDDKCLSIVTKAFQGQRAVTERSMKETMDDMVSAFDRHLEDSASSTKQQFRWMKRRYREKIDVNRDASRIELKDTILLNRCIYEDKTKEIDDRHKEEVSRLKVEFQLERSELRKQRRELEQSVEVLRLEKMQAEDDAAQAHRYIESLEEGVLFQSEDGSVRSHKHSPFGGRGTGVSWGNSRHASRNGSAQNSRHPSHHLLQRQESLNPNSSPRGGTGARNAFITGGTGSQISPRFTGGGGGGHGGHTGRLSPRNASSHPGYHHFRGGGGGGGTGVAVGTPQETARSPRGGFGSGQNTSRKAFTSRGEEAVGAALMSMGNSNRQLIDPTARHQEARQRFQEEMASKLMQVIDKTKVANLKEELADEVKNREAASARLELMEKAVVKLHEDLKKAQEQLVESRMETNELRRINTVMKTDLEQIIPPDVRESNEAVSRAELVLEQHIEASTVDIGGRNISPFRKANGTTTEVNDLATKHRSWAAASNREDNEEREIGQWETQQPTAEEGIISDSKGFVVKQGKKRVASEAAGVLDDLGLSDDTGDDEVYLRADGESKRDGGKQRSNDKRMVTRLEFENLNEVRRELESKIAKMQVESDENAFLKRRLEAIERTALKLNIRGTSNELQMLRERLDLESAEVVRLRAVVAALQNDKVALSEAAAKMRDETVPLVEVEAEREEFKREIAALKRQHQQEKRQLEYDMQRLADFKAEFQNLADGSLGDDDSSGRGSEGGVEGDGSTGGKRNGCEDGKWKLRAKKLKKYVQWQLAEAETQSRRDRAQMALKTRSHEILMGEMTVLVKRYRLDRGRLYEVNRTLVQRLAELEAQGPSSPVRDESGDAQENSGPHGRNVPPPPIPELVAVKQTNSNPNSKQRGRRRTRERGGSHGDGGRDGGFLYSQRAPALSTAVSNPSLVALVPTHTIENAPEVVAAVAAERGGKPFAWATGSALGGTGIGARRKCGENATKYEPSNPRPQTSTGCESRVRSKMATKALIRKLGGRNTRKEKTSMKVEVDHLARQLRSRVREEFFGPASDSARERVKGMRAATARFTSRDHMVVGKPLSSITGSVLTNVPLPLRIPAPDRDPAPIHGRMGVGLKSMRFDQMKGSGTRTGSSSKQGAGFW